MKKKTCNNIQRNFFFVLVLSFSTGIIFCQTKEIDSLKQALSITKEDTNKVNLLNLLCDKIWTAGNYAQTMNYGKEALGLAKQINFTAGIKEAHFNIGQAFFFEGEYTNAVNSFEKALEISKETGDNKGIAETHMYLAFNYSSQGLLSDAFKNFYAGLEVYKKINDKPGIANALQYIGNYYRQQGNLDEALNILSEALKIRREINDRSIGQTLNSIGVIKVAQKKYDEALQYHFEALKKFEALGDKTWNLASTYSSIGEVHNNRGKDFNTAGKKDSAVRSYSEALKYKLLSLGIHERTNIKLNIARILIEVGDQYQRLNDLREARKYYEKALEISKEKNLIITLERSYLHLSEVDSAENKYKQAYLHFKEYVFYRDSLKNNEELGKIEQIKLQNAFDKKEDSLKQKQVLTQTRLDSQKKQKNYYLGGAILLALLSVFVFLNFRNQKKINRLAGYAHAKEKAELELQSLRAQLNPHFMFNSLNAIQELILLEENEKSQSYLARFAKLLRLLLENADKPFIPLQREIDFLQLYLSLENLRIPDLQFSITVDPNINTEETKIPNMILQPYIENAIWHGLSHKANDKRLQIRVNNENGSTKYRIEDNGVGRKRSSELKSLYRKEHKSKGMELLSKRFRLLAKEYGSEVQTTVTDIENGKDSGTIVTIKVPNKLQHD